MKRLDSVPRPNWPASLEQAGVTYHSLDRPYWREEACYAFTADQVDELEEATAQLYAMCLTIVDEVITQDRFDRLKIPPWCRSAIRRSWEERHPSIYGRFDLRYDGTGPPLLLEFNADTPTSLVETSVAQWEWVEARGRHVDQFNSLHDKLIAAWQSLHLAYPVPLHLTGIPSSLEDAQTVAYLQDTAQQAGFETIPVSIHEIGWNPSTGLFVDRADRPIRLLFKLYPWEWLVREPFGHHYCRSAVTTIEPAWKMILSNKGLLPLLWERFPDHPNLLPAHWSPAPLGRTYVRKPLLSREGANVAIVTPESVTSTAGPYGEEGHVYQAYAPLPNFGGYHPVIGSWVVGGEPAGIGIRESAGLVTGDDARFVPHYFEPVPLGAVP